MTQFSKIYGASPVKNQIIFFNGHDSHFDERSLTQMQGENIQTFLIKAGDFISNQPNDNWPNSKLKSLYNVSKAKWILNYGNMRFQPHHMNSVLVETWKYFTVSAGNIIK